MLQNSLQWTEFGRIHSEPRHAIWPQKYQSLGSQVSHQGHWTNWVPTTRSQRLSEGVVLPSTWKGKPPSTEMGGHGRAEQGMWLFYPCPTSITTLPKQGPALQPMQTRDTRTKQKGKRMLKKTIMRTFMVNAFENVNLNALWHNVSCLSDFIEIILIRFVCASCCWNRGGLPRVCYKAT